MRLLLMPHDTHLAHCPRPCSSERSEAAVHSGTQPLPSGTSEKNLCTTVCAAQRGLIPSSNLLDEPL